MRMLTEDFGAMPAWDDDGEFPGTSYDGNAFSDVGEVKYMCVNLSSTILLSTVAWKSLNMCDAY